MDEGWEYFNFFVWIVYDVEKCVYKVEECVEEVEEGYMFLKVYLFIYVEVCFMDE